MNHFEEHEEATKKIDFYHNSHLNDVREKTKLSFLDKWKLKYRYHISPELYVELLNKYIEYSELEHRYNEEITRYQWKFLRDIDSYTKEDKRKENEARKNWNKYFELVREIDVKIMSYGTCVSSVSLGWFPEKHLKRLAESKGKRKAL